MKKQPKIGLNNSKADIEKGRKAAEKRMNEQTLDKLKPGFHKAANENRGNS